MRYNRSRMSDEPQATPVDFPAPPRAVTRAARGQSWREATVRRWVLATLGIALVVAAIGGRAVSAGRDERRLQRDGTRVEARIEQIYGQTGAADRSVARPVLLTFTLPGNAEPTQVPGDTSPMAGRIAVGQRIPILVDPANPSRWTDRVEPRGWPTVLAAPLLLSPLILALAAAAWRARSRALAVWRSGEAARGTVLDVQTSALVPGQKVLRVSLPGRTVAVTHPDRLGARQRGEAIDVVVLRGRAVAAAAYA